MLCTDDHMIDPSVISDTETYRMLAALALNWGVVGSIAAPIIIRSEVYGILLVLLCYIGIRSISGLNGCVYDLDEQLLKHGSPQGSHAFSTLRGGNLPPG